MVFKSHQGFRLSSGNQYTIAKKSNVSLENSQLLLTFTRCLGDGASKHLELVARNGISNGLSSFYQTLSDEVAELLLANLLNVSDSLEGFRTCDFLCVQDNQIHAILLEGLPISAAIAWFQDEDKQLVITDVQEILSKPPL